MRKILYTFNELMFEPVSKLFDDLKKYKAGFSKTKKSREVSFNSSIGILITFISSILCFIVFILIFE